jgi:hypothetical protein
MLEIIATDPLKSVVNLLTAFENRRTISPFDIM